MNHFSLKISLRMFYSIIMVAVLLFVANTSQAIPLTFENITNNSSIQLADQLAVETSLVDTEAAYGVAFTFYNNVGIDSSITDIYFDLGSNVDLFTQLLITEQSAGVSYDLTPNPENLPSGETISFYSDFGGDSLTPTADNGVNAMGEYITFLARLGSGFDYNDAMAAIFDGSLRVGMHIQAIAGGGAEDSDSYVNQVPVPAAGILFATALFGAGLFGRRKKKSTSTSMVGAFTRAS